MQHTSSELLRIAQFIIHHVAISGGEVHVLVPEIVMETVGREWHPKTLIKLPCPCGKCSEVGNFVKLKSGDGVRTLAAIISSGESLVKERKIEEACEERQIESLPPEVTNRLHKPDPGNERMN